MSENEREAARKILANMIKTKIENLIGDKTNNALGEIVDIEKLTRDNNDILDIVEEIKKGRKKHPEAMKQINEKMNVEQFKEIDHEIIKSVKEMNCPDSVEKLIPAFDKLKERILDKYTKEQILFFAQQMVMITCSKKSCKALNLQRRLCFGDDADFIQD